MSMLQCLGVIQLSILIAPKMSLLPRNDILTVQQWKFNFIDTAVQHRSFGRFFPTVMNRSPVNGEMNGQIPLM